MDAITIARQLHARGQTALARRLLSVTTAAKPKKMKMGFTEKKLWNLAKKLGATSYLYVQGSPLEFTYPDQATQEKAAETLAKLSHVLYVKPGLGGRMSGPGRTAKPPDPSKTDTHYLIIER